MQRTLIILIGAFVIVAGGYMTYDYLKEKPPPFLVELFTKTKPPPPLPEGPLAPLTVPAGFTATIFSRETPNARVLISDPNGVILASRTKDGMVVALPDTDRNGVADRSVTVLEGLKQPHGLLLRCEDTCTLYVAETNALKSYRYDPTTHAAVYVDTLMTMPEGSGHFTRTLLSHPDGNRIFVSIGSSCNVCIEESPLRASVQLLDPLTKTVSPYATGLRNSVFMEMHPGTGELWATENGRDVIGDDIPPDEINIVKEGGNYGWPYCYGKQVQDDDFTEKRPVNACQTSVPAHIDLPAHVAALGLAFVPATGWPAEWKDDVIIALHGSWNRSEPSGYKVVRIELDEEGIPITGQPVDIVTGFLAAGAKEDEAIGRPVGLLFHEGALYVSDDRAGAIYRITPNP